MGRRPPKWVFTNRKNTQPARPKAKAAPRRGPAFQSSSPRFPGGRSIPRSLQNQGELRGQQDNFNNQTPLWQRILSNPLIRDGLQRGVRALSSHASSELGAFLQSRGIHVPSALLEQVGRQFFGYPLRSLDHNIAEELQQLDHSPIAPTVPDTISEASTEDTLNDTPYEQRITRPDRMQEPRGSEAPSRASGPPTSNPPEEMTGMVLDTDEGGGSIASNFSTGVNAIIPRTPSQHTYYIHTQRTVRYDVPGSNEGAYTFDGGIADLFGAAIAGTPIVTPWYFLPTQTAECYMTPSTTAELFQLAGPRGKFRFIDCEVDILNTRLSMNLPLQATTLTSTDKPYFKCFEDKDQILFGHGFLSQAVTEIYPSTNAVTPAVFHETVTNMTGLPLPVYKHSVIGGPYTDQPAFQLPLESTGGVQYYSPGDTVHFGWKVNGRATAILPQSFAGGGLGREWWMSVDPETKRMRGFIGYYEPAVDFGRYPQITTADTALNQISTLHPEEYCLQPPPVLIQCPNVTSQGAGFDIVTQLHITVTYSAVLEVTREKMFSWAANYIINTTDTQESLQVIPADNASNAVRNPVRANIYSSRTRLGRGNITV